MNKIVIIGNFGKPGKVDGQIMKTRMVFNSIKKRYSDNYSIVKLDTSNKNILLYFRAIKEIISAYRIIILPAYSALKPLLFLINFLRESNKTIHIAIGGWLDDYLDKKKWVKKENKLIAVLVEMQSLKNSLEKIGLKNVVYFPNYREKTGEIVEISEKTTPYRRFVFYARVIPEKGVIDAIEAINVLNSKKSEYYLDIYGPIDNKFHIELDNILKYSPNVVYKKVLQQGEIISTLSKYDAMLFPTYYKGEGFPGTILESFMAGVPVIVSDWKYNKEIIDDGKTGLICKTHSVESIVDCIELLNNNIEKYKKMPINCKQKADEFLEERVTKTLFDIIDND